MLHKTKIYLKKIYIFEVQWTDGNIYIKYNRVRFPSIPKFGHLGNKNEIKSLRRLSSGLKMRFRVYKVLILGENLLIQFSLCGWNAMLSVLY